MSYGRGDPVEFELNTSDASSEPPALVLRESGSRASRTLAAGERFVLEQLNAHVVKAALPQNDITALIFADTDEGGTLDVADLMAVIGGGASHASFAPNGMAGALGVIPKVIASGPGQIYLTGTGYIMQG